MSQDHKADVHAATASLAKHPDGSAARKEAVFTQVSGWVTEDIAAAKALGATDAMLAPFVNRQATIQANRTAILAAM